MVYNVSDVVDSVQANHRRIYEVLRKEIERNGLLNEGASAALL